jgi:hypothetical protein
MKFICAIVTTMQEGTTTALNHIWLMYGDDAYKVLEGWVNNHPHFEPTVRCICQSTAKFVGSDSRPPTTLWGTIRHEALAVVFYYQTVREEDLEGFQ